MLFSVKRRAVPPVESISILRALRALANSTMPVLSETLMRALVMDDIVESLVAV
jgi:hypothetical protein